MKWMVFWKRMKDCKKVFEKIAFMGISFQKHVLEKKMNEFVISFLAKFKQLDDVLEKS